MPSGERKCMTTRKELVDRYKKAGWQLIPLKGKIRFTKAGENVDELLYDEQYNVGLLTGDIVVVDFDSEEAHSKYEENLSSITLVSKTPRGWHYFYKSPEGVTIRNDQSKKIGENVDIRGVGGYVVIPPSKGYEWKNTHNILPLPHFITEKYREEKVPEEPVEINTTKACEILYKYPCYRKMFTSSNVQKGEHHHSAVRMIACLRHEGIEEEEIIATVCQWDVRNNNYLGNKHIRKLYQRQSNRTYLYDCKDALLVKHCDPVTCPLKQMDEKYVPLLDVANSPDVIQSLLEVSKSKIPEIPISLPKFNNKMWGLRRGELTVVAGFASYGKSAFVNQLSLDVANTNKTVLLFSSESSCEEVMRRLLANHFSIQGSSFRTGWFTPEEEKVKPLVADVVRNWKLFVCDKSQPTAEDMEFAIRTIKPDLFVLDYLQRCVHGSNRYEKINDMMLSLKSFAKIYNLPVVVASQIGRASKVDGAKPGLHHLLGSGSIEQEGDNVLILDRTESKDDDDEAYVTGYLEKGRNIGCGKFMFKFDKKYLRFTEIDEPEVN